MDMELATVFVRRPSTAHGDLATSLSEQVFAQLGKASVVSESQVAGAFLPRVCAAAFEAGARELACTTELDGQLVLSDPSHELCLELEAWCELSAQLQTRVVIARHESLGVEFAVFESGRCLRLLSWEPGEELVQVGTPLPQESLFRGPVPTLEELYEWLACMGLDLERLNRRSAWTVHALEDAAAPALRPGVLPLAV